MESWEWVFLLYSNGNNELEPEAWRSVQEVKRARVGENICRVVQVSRETEEMVALLRPGQIATVETERWSGTRRYVFDGAEQSDCYHLDNVNMAEPSTLCEFLDWALDRFPGKHYMLSLSGHIYQFVGLCPDYSGAKPLLLGFPELSHSLQYSFDRWGRALDILVLDTCYASTVEILYELAKYPQPRVERVLTYIGPGPLAGLPYGRLLALLAEAAFSPVDAILTVLVEGVTLERTFYGLVALRPEHELLELIKELLSKLAALYLLYGEAMGVVLTPEELLADTQPNHPWASYIQPLHRLLGAVVVAKRLPRMGSDGLLPIHLLSQWIPDVQRAALYRRLAFAQQNAWMTLLCREVVGEQAPSTASAAAEVSRELLATFLHASCEQLSPGELFDLTEALIRQKGWSYPEGG